MNPVVKKLVTAIAVKEAIERVQAMRAPKPSALQRMRPLLFLAGLGGAAFYLMRSGRAGALLGRQSDHEPYSAATATPPAAPSGDQDRAE